MKGRLQNKEKDEVVREGEIEKDRREGESVRKG